MSKHEATTIIAAAELNYLLEDLNLSGPGQSSDALNSDDLAIVAAMDGKPVKAEIVTIADESAPVTKSERDGFYKRMSPTDAKDLQDAADRIRHMQKKAILEMGNELIRVKNAMSGHFDRWLKVEFEWSKSTAWNIINAVERFGSQPKVLERLPSSAVYILASKSTPDDVRKAVVQEVERGKRLSLQDVKERISAAKEDARIEKLVQREKQVIDRITKQEEEAAKVEALAWQQREQELRKEGQSADEIKDARKRWNSATERNARERARQQEQARNAALTQGERSQVEQHERFKIAEQQANAAVRYILDHFTGDADQLRTLLKGVQRYSFGDTMLRALND